MGGKLPYTQLQTPHQAKPYCSHYTSKAQITSKEHSHILTQMLGHTQTFEVGASGKMNFKVPLNFEIP